jgi:hypothetical protein
MLESKIPLWMQVSCISKLEYFIKTINIYDNFINGTDIYISQKLTDFHLQYLRHKINEDEIVIQILMLNDSASHHDLNIMWIYYYVLLSNLEI